MHVKTAITALMWLNRIHFDMIYLHNILLMFLKILSIKTNLKVIDVLSLF